MSAKLLQISLFSTYKLRNRICFPNLRELSKVSKHNLDLFTVVVYTTEEIASDWESFASEMSEKGMSISISPIRTHDYMTRTLDASKTQSPYSCRLDDDLFLSSHLWEFILNNLHVLEDPNTLAISPIISTAIPTVDYFVEDFFNAEDRINIQNIFVKDNIVKSPWHGIDYSHLYNFISSQSDWKVNEYYQEVARHHTVFKGIHPIRFSDDANMFMCKHIIKNFSKFMSKQQYYLDTLSGVHNTHLFAWRTETWRESLKHLYDNFDEICMNVYGLNRNMVTYIVRNGFAIHMAHGYVPSQKIIEGMYYDCVESL